MNRYRLIVRDAHTPSTWPIYECTHATVEEVAHRYINDELTPDHKSLEFRLASSVAEISDHYRFDHDCSHYEQYTEILKKYRTMIPLILFRGVSSIPFERMVSSAKELGNPTIDFYEKGFMSCSLLPDLASTFHGIKQFMIFVRPLTNLMYVGRLTQEYQPNCLQEVILQRGAKLELIREDENYYYCYLKETI